MSVREIQAVFVEPGNVIVVRPNFSARHRKFGFDPDARMLVTETRTTMFHNVRITLENGTTYTFQPGDQIPVEWQNAGSVFSMPSNEFLEW